MATPPIIIIGMHRSGTSIITRLLKRLGLFVGNRLLAEEEATFFIRHNAWLLRACGGRWDTPHVIDYLHGLPHVADYLRARLNSVWALEFLGGRRYIQTRSIFRLHEAWGWKDPRTTITLPVWLQLFPDAKIVHVVRNGVAVADSLRRREKNAFEQAVARFERHPRLLALRGKRGWFGTSPRVMNLAEGFHLWEEYVAYAHKYIEFNSTSTPLLEMRYEDFVADPVTQLTTLAAFCGLTADPATIAAACTEVRRARWNQNAELQAFWQTVRHSAWMVHYGYGEP